MNPTGIVLLFVLFIILIIYIIKRRKQIEPTENPNLIPNWVFIPAAIIASLIILFFLITQLGFVSVPLGKTILFYFIIPLGILFILVYSIVFFYRGEIWLAIRNGMGGTYHYTGVVARISAAIMFLLGASGAIWWIYSFLL